MSFYDCLKLTEEPLIELKNWIDEANTNGAPLPHAMNLATVDKTGRPSARMVLMKSLSDEGLVFFTDYSSQKGRHLAENSFSSCTFWWPSTDKQIRIDGECSKVPDLDSDRYFESRPLGSQISAIISRQSSEIQTYEELVQDSKKFKEKNNEVKLNRPERWGGYLLRPFRIEFWETQSNRLHKRKLYPLDSHKGKKSLLSP